ncbi:unnamed protein product [Ectocarpus sp. CCAP 1310/34]|nr:unnamed protein product [Ectocarpus sp. CCAP 1310/34]
MPGGAAPPPVPVTVLRGHTSGVHASCYLKEDILLTGSEDGVVKLWNLERRRAFAEFEATSHGMGVQRLDHLGRGKIVSQGRDMLIKVWDAESLAAGGGSGVGSSSRASITPQPLQVLPTGAFHFCQFALTRWREEARPKGKESTNSSSGGGGEHDPREEKKSGERRREEERSPPGGQTGREGDAAEPAPSAAADDGEAQQGSFLSDESSFAENVMLAPCGQQTLVSLWDLRKARPSFTFAPKDAEQKGMVMCVRLLGESPSCASPFAVVGHDAGHLCVYDLRATSAEPLLESRLHKVPLLCVDVGSSCRQGVSGSADESINVFTLSTRKASCGSCEVVKSFRLEHPGTSCVEIRRDQKLFVSGGWDHRVRAFSWKTPRPLAVLRSHEKNVHTVAYSPRIGGLVSGSGDSRVAVWELYPERNRGGGGRGGGDDAMRDSRR